MATLVGSAPVPACSRACANPERPSHCDPVNPMGICDSFERDPLA